MSVSGIQSRTTKAVFDSSGRVRGVELKVYSHGPRFVTAEHVTLEISHNGITTSLSLTTGDAAWLGHTLLSAQDDALRAAGPNYGDNPAGRERIIDDHTAQQRAEDSASFDAYRDSVMDPRD